MILLSINRSVIFALQSFWRNIWLSVATIFIIFLAFISVNFLVVLNATSDAAIEAVKDRVDISINFNQTVKESKIIEVKSYLETLPQVKKIVYRSPDENLESFTSRHKTDELIQESLQELDSNPLGATLVISAKSLKDYPEILKAVDNPAYASLIEQKTYDDHQLVISRINSITDSVKKAGLIISLMFIVISILIVYNTVRIAIFTHRNQIEIMKLVGATNWFIRAPFIIESIISGTVALIVTIIVIYPLLSVIQPHFADFFQGGGFNIINYFNSNFIIIFGGQLIGIVVINIIASSVAITRYLKI